MPNFGYHYQDLVSLFNGCFQKDYKTVLVKGDEEPLYLPAEPPVTYHQVIFAHGFFSSALHECAHWFIAGAERRQQVDYGYWYNPDGRTAEQQVLFQQVEVKPQAIEWVLSKACGYGFHFSFDNLNGECLDMTAFKEAVQEQVMYYETRGLPRRAARFHQALCQFYSHAHALQ